MDENNLYSGFGDDGTFVPFTDIVLNVLLGFTFLVLLTLALVNPEAKAGSVDIKAEVLITVSWPDGGLPGMTSTPTSRIPKATSSGTTPRTRA